MKRTTILILFTLLFFQYTQAQTYGAFVPAGDSIYVYDIEYRNKILSFPKGNFENIRNATSSNNFEQIYLAGFDYNLYKINPLTQSIIKSEPTPAYELLLSPDERYLYGTKLSTLYKIDTATLLVLDSFVFPKPYPNAGSYSYFNFLNDSILFMSTGKVYKYNINTKTILDSMDEQSASVYNNQVVTYKSAKELVFRNPHTLERDTSISLEVGIRHIWAFNPTNNHLYITYSNNSSTSNRIYVYSLNTFTLVNTIETKYQPWYLNLSPDGKLWMFNFDKPLITVADTKTFEVVDSIQVNYLPNYIVFGKTNDFNTSIAPLHTKPTLKLYPNPATNKITLETGYNEVKNFTVINSHGKTIMSFKSNGTKTEVDVSTLPPGVYFVIADGDKTKAIKFIKQ